MDENLMGAGEAALEKTEAQRQAKAQLAAERRRNGQTPAKYVRTDANQGLIEVQGADGGRALVSEQGSLSNRAIAPGESVRLYQDEKATGWQKIDCKPIEKRILVPTVLVPKRLVPTVIGDEDGDGEPEPEPVPTPPAPPTPGYCSTQCFWYKGKRQPGPAIAPEPVTLDWDTRNGPISANYDYEIESVASQGGAWKPAPTLSPLPCPSPVDFSGNSIYHEFDGVGQYGDNSGVCSYIVSFVEAPTPLPSNKDKNKWQAVCSSNAPISFDIDTNSSRSRITIWDQITTKDNPLAILDFDPGRFSYLRRCAEEGPP